MKKIFFLAAAASVLISQTGCFGSFSLVNSVYAFNKEVSGDKLVQTLVFYGMIIIPVYAIAGFIDIVILNLIEFWTGSNPMSMKAGEIEEQMMTFKGNTYKVTATQNTFEFEKLKDGVYQKMGAIVYSTENRSWNFKKGGLSQELIKFNKDNTVGFKTLEGEQTYSIQDVECLMAKDSAKEIAVY